MEALGIVLAIAVGFGVLLVLGFFGFVIWFIASTFFSVRRSQKQFNREWTKHDRSRLR